MTRIERREGGDEQDGGDGDGGPHGPGGTWFGSQSRSPLASRHGAEPSALACDAAPGQRRSWFVSSPSKRCDGGIGVSTPPAGLSSNWNALKIGWIRA